MAVKLTKTDEVLAAARNDLQAQLAVVQADLGRLVAEERALTEALSSIETDGASPSSPSVSGGSAGRRRPARSSARRSSARKAGAGRRRRRRGASKPTADRVKELEGILGDGPRSRNDLAAALGVSPARVQQLLAELGGSVTSAPDPGQRRGKLWSLKASGNGASAAKPAAKRAPASAKGSSTRKRSARSDPAAKK